MVELIVTEDQLACLKAVVPVGSDEAMALNRGERFGTRVLSPEPIAVKCTPEIAIRLMAVAEQACPDVVPEIRAAIEQGPLEPIGESVSVGLALTTERLEWAVELLRQYDPHERYRAIWTALTTELDRRRAGAAPQRIMVHSRDLSGLPFAAKEMLRRG